jgi:hypothetical protein
MMMSNAAIGAIMNFSLNSLWGMINSLQIVGYIGLMPISFPAGVLLVYGKIQEIISFSLIDTTDFFSKIF